MLTKDIKLSIVIPAYNEEKRISNVISSYTSFFNERYDYELIVVSDGNDDTNNIVKNLIITNDRICLIELPKRQGKGGGILEGFKKSNGDILAFVDSDESVLPQEFNKLLNNLYDSDCAIASRRIEGACIDVNQPFLRRTSSKIFNIIVNLIFDLGIKDTQCGAKVFKKEVIDQVISLIKTKGFEFDVELLWRIKNKGYRIKEVPIVWNHTAGSTFSLAYSYKMFISLIKIRVSE